MKTSNISLFKGFNKLNQFTKQDDKYTPVAVFCDVASVVQKDKSGVTIALEDFNEKAPNSFNGKDSLNITSKDAKKKFFQKESDNIFEQEKTQNYLKEVGNFYQNDIYNQEIAYQGGIRYNDSNEYIKSALNYAKAEIEGIEKEYTLSHVKDDYKKDGKLQLNEMGTYADIENVFNLKACDLDGDEAISPEEYASYVLMVDGLSIYDSKNDKAQFDPLKIDGLLIKEEVEKAMENSDVSNQQAAKAVYDKYYNK